MTRLRINRSIGIALGFLSGAPLAYVGAWRAENPLAAGSAKKFEKPVRRGQGASGEWTTEAPGVRRHITAADIPAPFHTPSTDNGPKVVPRPEGMWPKAPEGFTVTQFATGLSGPREINTAPNGDIFVTESGAGRLKVLRDTDGDGKSDSTAVFTDGLRQPFGVAFYPLGRNPQFVYVANTDSVVRFPYNNGDTRAGGPEETIVPDLPGGG